MERLIMLSTVLLTVTCSIYYLLLYFKMSKIDDNVNEIKRKMKDEK